MVATIHHRTQNILHEQYSNISHNFEGFGKDLLAEDFANNPMDNSKVI